MTAAIDQLVGLFEGFDPALLANLSEEDRLDAFARAVEPGNPQGDRALAILARTDPGPEGLLAAAVAQLLADVTDPFGAVLSAVSLAAAAGPEIVPLVLGVAAVTSDPLVGLAAWRTLQQVAKGEQLEALEAVAPPPGDVVGDQAAFAISLVANRAGLPGHEPTVPGEEEFLAIDREEPVRPIVQSDLDPTESEAIARLSSGELYLVRPNAPTLVECGENGGLQMVICPDDDVLESSPFTLLQAPAMPAVILLREREGFGHSALYLPVTWPDEEGGIHLLMFQPDGTSTHYGHAHSEDVNDSEANFTVFFALNRPGVERAALNLNVTSEAVTLTGEMVGAVEISGDRLEPEPE
ncbi:MAG TPA: hypothetical protein VF081_13475 [Solirubrobacterales bacterium]